MGHRINELALHEENNHRAGSGCRVSDLVTVTWRRERVGLNGLSAHAACAVNTYRPASAGVANSSS